MAIRFYSDALYRNYLKEVEESGVLRELREVRIPSGKGLVQVLKRSQILARREFSQCHTQLIKLFQEISEIEKSIKDDIHQISKQYPTYGKLWHEVFDDFNLKLGKIFEYAQEKLIGSFSKKVRRMDNFIICLFGRTKAGKSTTMEALTHGDGATIGVGRQNTTTDTKQYDWKGLLVVDTPGIDAMDKQDELETKALDFADESDLIVFLMPHQIEEGDFDKFMRFYRQSKPIVILLNKKKDVGKPGTIPFKMFLSHPEEVLREEELSGYVSRINSYIFSKLGIPEGLIPIIPIHSYSAFMSHCKAFEIDTMTRDKLHKISNFQLLEEHLTQEILSYGELYRIKNPHETVILFSSMIQEPFEEFIGHMSAKEIVFETNARKFSGVKSKIQEKRDAIYKEEFSSYFHNKREAVPDIVTRLFEAGNNKERQKQILSDFMPSDSLQQKVKRCQSKASEMVRKEIESFFESFKQELTNIDLGRHKDGVGSGVNRNLSDIAELTGTANLMQGISMTTGVLLSLGAAVVLSEGALVGAAGTLFGIGSANVWNPVGWALLALSAGFGIWGWTKKKEIEEKIRKAKEQARRDLKDSVDKTEAEIRTGFNKWVDEIVHAVQKDHVDLMTKYAEYARKHLKAMNRLVSVLNKMRTDMQKAKYESMLKNRLRSRSVHVLDVNSTSESISVRVVTQSRIDLPSLQAQLSRVEEKSVRLEVVSHE